MPYFRLKLQILAECFRIFAESTFTSSKSYQIGIVYQYTFIKKSQLILKSFWRDIKVEI